MENLTSGERTRPIMRPTVVLCSPRAGTWRPEERPDATNAKGDGEAPAP